jgi:hypothetical protein
LDWLLVLQQPTHSCFRSIHVQDVGDSQTQTMVGHSAQVKLLGGIMDTQVNITLPFTKKLRSTPFAIEVQPADVFGKLGQSLVVYDEEGRWLGEVLWMPWCGDGLIAVRPDRRRQGIGTRLLAVAVELWPEADLMRQKLYSEEGSRLVENFLRKETEMSL